MEKKKMKKRKQPAILKRIENKRHVYEEVYNDSLRVLINNHERLLANAVSLIQDETYFDKMQSILDDIKEFKNMVKLSQRTVNYIDTDYLRAKVLIKFFGTINVEASMLKKYMRSKKLGLLKAQMFLGKIDGSLLFECLKISKAIKETYVIKQTKTDKFLKHNNKLLKQKREVQNKYKKS